MITTINESLFPGFSNFKECGSGSYGNVYVANHKSGVKIAVKTVDNINLITEENRTVFRSELETFRKIDHPFLAQFYGFTEDKAGSYIVMENVENGTLLSYIKQKKRLKENEAAKIYCELLSALSYLHKDLQTIHRDVKADNILLDEFYDIRLIDFGLSSHMETEDKEFSLKCGSFPYSAPEMLKGQRYTKSVDIWSSGVTLYMMVTGLFPFAGNDQRELMMQIIHSEPNYPNYLSSSLVDLLHKILTKDPQRRLTIEEISQHPWISGSSGSYYLHPDFTHKTEIHPIPKDDDDVKRDIVDKLADNGYDVSTLTYELRESKITETALLYKILLKQKCMETIRSPQEIRKMLGFRKKLDITKKPQIHKTSSTTIKNELVLQQYSNTPHLPQPPLTCATPVLKRYSKASKVVIGNFKRNTLPRLTSKDRF